MPFPWAIGQEVSIEFPEAEANFTWNHRHGREKRSEKGAVDRGRATRRRACTSKTGNRNVQHVLPRYPRWAEKRGNTFGYLRLRDLRRILGHHGIQTLKRTLESQEKDRLIMCASNAFVQLARHLEVRLPPSADDGNPNTTELQCFASNLTNDQLNEMGVPRGLWTLLKTYTR